MGLEEEDGRKDRGGERSVRRGEKRGGVKFGIRKRKREKRGK